jgi:glucose/arabinose dehydrogenase
MRVTGAIGGGVLDRHYKREFRSRLYWLNANEVHWAYSFSAKLMKRIFLFLFVSIFASVDAISETLAYQLFASGLSRPVFMTFPPGDTNRLFVIEQHTGLIRILDSVSGVVNETPFMAVSGLMTDREQGLLGMAFHPGYRTNGYFYLNYTTTGGGAAGHTEVARFQVTGDPLTSGTADPATKKIIISFDQPEENHNGGWIGFGPDGYLYIATGDGGGAYDNHGSIGNAQDREVLLGKILRLDVDDGDPYGSPETNRYKNDPLFRPEILAFGLRNPWRCSFDRETGDLWIADVGEIHREEIDRIPAGVGGLNFRWRDREGITPTFSPATEPVTPATDPVFDYFHGQYGNCVIGGYVYRGTEIPQLRGGYLSADYGGAVFRTTRQGGDYVTAEISREFSRDILKNTNSEAGEKLGSLPETPGATSFAEDSAGELYLLNLAGSIGKIVSMELPNPELTPPEILGTNQFTFGFEGQKFQSYLIESSPDLSPSSWNLLNRVMLPAPAAVQVTNLITEQKMYFRVRTP